MFCHVSVLLNKYYVANLIRVVDVAYWTGDACIPEVCGLTFLVKFHWVNSVCQICFAFGIVVCIWVGFGMSHYGESSETYTLLIQPMYAVDRKSYQEFPTNCGSIHIHTASVNVHK